MSSLDKPNQQGLTKTDGSIRIYAQPVRVREHQPQTYQPQTYQPQTYQPQTYQPQTHQYQTQTRQPSVYHKRVTYRVTVDFPDWLSVVVLPVTIALTTVVLLTLYFGVQSNTPRVFVDSEGNVYQIR